tara:strand:- start:15 stop:845 length:831 start_codon:yes stop_codon:yes gene_type:complete
MSLKEACAIRDLLYKQQTTKSSDDDIVEYMPLSCISQVLDDYPIVKMLNVSKTEVHKCLTHILHRKRELLSKPKLKNTSKFKCKNEQCNSNNILLNHRDGNYTCYDCGTIQNFIVYGENIKTSITESEMKQLESNTDTNLPNWVHAQDQLGDKWHEFQLSSLVEHWNAYIHAKKDDLTYIKEAATWMERRASDESRIAAAFIFVLVMEPQLDYSKLNGIYFPHISYKTPSAYKKCKLCKASIFENEILVKSHKCLKTHERKQWSFVKNKKTKLKFC